jgi:hypothetical protein
LILATGEYTTPQWTGANAGQSYQYQATITGTVQLENTTAEDIYTNPIGHNGLCAIFSSKSRYSNKCYLSIF